MSDDDGRPATTADDDMEEMERETASDEGDHTEDTMTDNATDDTEPKEDRSDLRRRLNYALLGGLSLLALIATIQLYINVSAAINQWITYEYRSLFQAAFNLAVLLLVSTGIVWQVRRLRE